MDMTKSAPATTSVLTALVVVAVFVVSFGVVPLAIATSTGSAYPMEIIRAHTAYQVTDPASPVQSGLGVHGNR